MWVLKQFIYIPLSDESLTALKLACPSADWKKGKGIDLFTITCTNSALYYGAQPGMSGSNEFAIQNGVLYFGILKNLQNGKDEANQPTQLDLVDTFTKQ